MRAILTIEVEYPATRPGLLGKATTAAMRALRTILPLVRLVRVDQVAIDPAPGPIRRNTLPQFTAADEIPTRPDIKLGARS
jgi:hypothetical protein